MSNEELFSLMKKWSFWIKKLICAKNERIELNFQNSFRLLIFDMIEIRNDSLWNQSKKKEKSKLIWVWELTNNETRRFQEEQKMLNERQLFDEELKERMKELKMKK